MRVSERLGALGVAGAVLLAVPSCTSVDGFASVGSGLPRPSATSAFTHPTTSTPGSVPAPLASTARVSTSTPPASTSISSTVASTSRTKTSTTAPTSTMAVTADAVLQGLAADLKSGNRAHFLARFAQKLKAPVGAWFDNTRRLGVTAATFAPTYAAAATGSSFNGKVILGIRTPYDPPDSTPGVRYSAVISSTSAGSAVTAWEPASVDPFFCSCRMNVTKSGRIAVITRANDSKLAAWPEFALSTAAEATGWVRRNAKGSGVALPSGMVFFLSDAPYRWYSDPKSAAKSGNVTYTLLEAGGNAPGTTLSRSTRTVVSLGSGEKVLTPGDVGGLYLGDSLAHEFTHQVMSYNGVLESGFKLAGRSPHAPEWVTEGLADAVAILHRRSQTDIEDYGYDVPNDPANVDQSWLAAHVDRAPTDKDLDGKVPVDAENWSAVAASTFLYVAANRSFAEMLATGRKAMEAGASFIDPWNEFGRYGSVSGIGVSSADYWLAWFTGKYVE